MMLRALKNFKDAGNYDALIWEWEAMPAATQTYANLKTMMSMEYSKLIVRMWSLPEPQDMHQPMLLRSLRRQRKSCSCGIDREALEADQGINQIKQRSNGQAHRCSPREQSARCCTCRFCSSLNYQCKAV
jgi:hypothetical protein